MLMVQIPIMYATTLAFQVILERKMRTSIPNLRCKYSSPSTQYLSGARIRLLSVPSKTYTIVRQLQSVALLKLRFCQCAYCSGRQTITEKKGVHKSLEVRYSFLTCLVDLR